MPLTKGYLVKALANENGLQLSVSQPHSGLF